jgi:tetratricopeptide (TPR) repeat protein
LERADDAVALALARLELAQFQHSRDPEAARGLMDAVRESEVAAVPVVAVALHELRAALAWADGNLEAVGAALRDAVAASSPAAPASRPRLVLCDLLVDEELWAELETVSRGLMDEALLLRQPELLALAQRFLGLALVETGRPVEAAELLEAALPVIRDSEPRLLGPVGWALGNALSALGERANARTAYATAAMGFEAEERLTETAHAHLRAGNAAWGEDDTAAAVHLDAAVDFASRAGDPPLYAGTVRDRAGLRGSQGETGAGLAELDGLVVAVVAMGKRTDQSLPEAYLSWLERAILRQGAHLLDRNGETTAAERRLLRAEHASTDDPRFRSICRTERGAMLARLGRLDEAESIVRDGVTGLDPTHDRGVRVEAVGAVAQAIHDSGDVQRADRIWEELVESVAD